MKVVYIKEYLQWKYNIVLNNIIMNFRYKKNMNNFGKFD